MEKRDLKEKMALFGRTIKEVDNQKGHDYLGI